MTRRKRNTRTRPLVVGLTGGIASGKTTVLAELEKRGAAVIDADRIGREVVRPGMKAWRKIRKTFGAEVLLPGGEIDRRRLGEVVFASPAKRKLLEDITHPEINRRIRDAVRKARPASGVIVIDIPLLFEKGLEDTVDRTVVVWAPVRERKARLRLRDHLPRREIDRRIRAQMPLGEKRKRADYVIDNSGTPGSVRGEIKKFWGVLTKAGQ